MRLYTLAASRRERKDVGRKPYTSLSLCILMDANIKNNAFSRFIVKSKAGSVWFQLQQFPRCHMCLKGQAQWILMHIVETDCLSWGRPVSVAVTLFAPWCLRSFRIYSKLSSQHGITVYKNFFSWSVTNYDKGLIPHVCIHKGKNYNNHII